jgi:hypothetical protein
MSVSPYRTRSKAAVNVVAPNADPVVMGKPDLGYRPADMNAYYQIHVTGLDSGTYDVELYLPGDQTTPKPHQTGATETDTVLIDGPMVEAFRVTFALLGVAAAPVVYLTAQGRV